jgi:hypothetical protein
MLSNNKKNRKLTIKSLHQNGFKKVGQYTELLNSKKNQYFIYADVSRGLIARVEFEMDIKIRIFGQLVSREVVTTIETPNPFNKNKPFTDIVFTPYLKEADLSIPRLPSRSGIVSLVKFGTVPFVADSFWQIEALSKHWDFAPEWKAKDVIFFATYNEHTNDSYKEASEKRYSKLPEKIKDIVRKSFEELSVC